MAVELVKQQRLLFYNENRHSLSLYQTSIYPFNLDLVGVRQLFIVSCWFHRHRPLPRRSTPFWLPPLRIAKQPRQQR